LGERRLLPIGDLALECGGELPSVTLAYETWGHLNARGDNAVLIQHALTGDSHVRGTAGPGHPTAGWWDDLVGPGRGLDPERWFVVAANAVGGCRGSTGPSSLAPDGRPWGSRFPFVTIRDMVNAEASLADHLGVGRWAAVIGGSMGGMRALEWAATHPERVARCVALATTAYATADQIAWCQPQLLAIRHDPAFRGGDYYATGRAPEVGLGIARRIAHTTYRSADELGDRFGRSPQAGENPLGDGGRYAVESYLDYHAQKLIDRFDANSYLVLTQAMNSHDLGRGRGGLRTALAAIRTRLVVAAVDSDRLYPRRLSEEIVAGVPDAGPVVMISSPFGHDGFLTEADQVAEIVRRALDH
jgi:homoserine O-acetyltransferase